MKTGLKKHSLIKYNCTNITQCIVLKCLHDVGHLVLASVQKFNETVSIKLIKAERSFIGQATVAAQKFP